MCKVYCTGVFLAEFAEFLESPVSCTRSAIHCGCFNILCYVVTTAPSGNYSIDCLYTYNNLKLTVAFERFLPKLLKGFFLKTKWEWVHLDN